MKILNVSAKNFGSFKEVYFNFISQGLTLIAGPTGAGKSTLCDLVPWVLFGTTSKNGSVDEVRNWQAEGPTEGKCAILLSDYTICIHRSRAPNDLFFEIDFSGAQRGKDLADTQRLINQTLNTTAETFLAGSYFHELSQTAQFFTATAKNRRQLIEQIVDLSLAKQLTEHSIDYKKEIKHYIEATKLELSDKKAVLNAQKSVYESYKRQVTDWETDQVEEVQKLKELNDNFEDDRQQELEKLTENWLGSRKDTEDEIATLKTGLTADSTNYRADLQKRIAELDKQVCKECGAPKGHQEKLVLISDLNRVEQKETKKSYTQVSIQRLEQYQEKKDKAYKLAKANLESATNSYNKILADKEKEINPFKKLVKEEKAKMQNTTETVDILQNKLNDFQRDKSDVELLEEVIATLRQTLSQSTVTQLENSVNSLLEEHFDGEIMVNFKMDSADKLDTLIYKDGNLAAYTQLSKGQRGLLRLCFSIGVMKACNNNSSVSCLFFDESMDGLSEDLKVKAFGLFQKLAESYESVFVIDHSEALKSKFNNKYTVTLINGESQLG